MRTSAGGHSCPRHYTKIGEVPRLPATLRALQYRNFQLFFGGQLISLIGTWMQNVAQSWLVYRLTGLRGAAGRGRFLPARFPSFCCRRWAASWPTATAASAW